MAWGWASRKDRNSVEWTGFLERGVKLDGRLETTGTFRIDSEMKGHLLSEDTLIVGENAVIVGQITGHEIVVAGRFDGIIRSRASVELRRNAIVTGEVHTSCLILEPGAVFDGQCFLPPSSAAGGVIAVSIRSSPMIGNAKS
jgi:cytoskeletal protein CcmA (bactofilin family)